MQHPHMITIEQPWAWAVLAGIRPIITRSWSAPTAFNHVWLDQVPSAYHLMFNSPEFATQPVAAHDTYNGGIAPAPRGWKAAFEAPAEAG